MPAEPQAKRQRGGVYYLHNYQDLHGVSGEYQEKSSSLPGAKVCILYPCSLYDSIPQ